MVLSSKLSDSKQVGFCPSPRFCSMSMTMFRPTSASGSASALAWEILYKLYYKISQARGWIQFNWFLAQNDAYIPLVLTCELPLLVTSFPLYLFIKAIQGYIYINRNITNQNTGIVTVTGRCHLETTWHKRISPILLENHSIQWHWVNRTLSAEF